MAYQTGTLTGSYELTANGTPQEGSVEIRPDNIHGNTIRDATGKKVLSGPLTGKNAIPLVAGAFSVDLPASNDSTLDPAGVTYTVYVRLAASGAGQKAVKGVYITAGQTVDMSSLVSVSPADPSYQERVNEATASATNAAGSATAAAGSATTASSAATAAAGSATAAGSSATAAAGSATAAAGSATTAAATLAGKADVSTTAKDLPDTTVGGASGQLAASVTSNVAANGAYTSPALDGAVATPPKRWAIKADPATGCTITLPDVTGTPTTVTMLPGEALTFRQKSTLGWGVESGNKPLTQLQRQARLAAQVERGVQGGDLTFLSATEVVTLGAAAGTSWTQHTIRVAGSGLWFSFSNKRMNGSTSSPNYNDADPATALPIKASIRVVSTPSGNNVNVIRNLRFNGALNVSIDPSGDVSSDFLPLPCEVGMVVEVRVYTTATSWAPSASSAHSGQQMGFISGSDSTQTAGALTSSFGSLLAPSVVRVKPLPSAAVPAVALVAFSMSIDAGAYDDFNQSAGFNAKPQNVLDLGGSGWIARACRTAGIPFSNGSLPGDTVAKFITFTARYARTALAGTGWWTDCLTPNPTNDLAGGTTSAACQSLVIQAWGILGSTGFGMRLWAGTVGARDTSTDNFATTANQTNIGAAFETNRVAYNTWLRDGAPMIGTTPQATGTSGSTVARCAVYGATGALVTAASGPTHLLAGVWEYADTVESARNSGKWAPADGTVTGLSITTGTNALSSASPAFDATMVGKVLVIPGAGAAGAALIASIFSYTDSTHVVLGANAGTTVSGVSAPYGIKTAYQSAGDPGGTHPSSLGHKLAAACVPVAAIAVPA